MILIAVICFLSLQKFMNETMELCESCRKFDIHSFSADLDGRRGYKVAAVRKAADTGCTFCTFLMARFQGDLVEQDDKREELWIHLVPLEDSKNVGSNYSNLRINRLHLELGPRYYIGASSRWPITPTDEVCVAADPGMCD
jgi:hypothetical protein